MMLPCFSSQREKEKYFRSLNEEQKPDALNEIIEESEHIVFLGGAGVWSRMRLTESLPGCDIIWGTPSIEGI